MTHTPTCGGCGSVRLEFTCSGAYAVCLDCLRLQEPEHRADPHVQMCNNCAFRPGSPERAEPFSWMRFQERHIEDGVPFYCHKGLKVELQPGHVVSFKPQSDDEMKRKPCVGWFAHRMAYLSGARPEPITEFVEPA
ncbi:MAG: hypothetical protein AAFP87_20420 [Pseudomonadota bacterium]